MQPTHAIYVQPVICTMLYDITIACILHMQARYTAYTGLLLKPLQLWPLMTNPF